jgi:hypothetical protein
VAEVSVRDAGLHVELTVSERVLALHRRNVDVPHEQIVDARAVPDLLAHVRGLRSPGTGIPGLVAIGTWVGTADGKRYHDFVIAHHKGSGVIVTAEGGDYDRVLVGSPDPDGLVRALVG